jgi:hypothetical protein
VKIEGTYGTDSVPTGAANAILAEDVKLTPMEGQDVTRGHERPYLGARPTIPTGLYSKISFKGEVKGSGVAGTPPASAVLLRACAMAETIVAATSVTYNPVSSGHESCTIYFNSDGTNYVLKGARGTFTYRVTAQGVVFLEFEMTGLFSQPAAVTLPTPTYGTQLTQAPEVATSANTPTFTVGAVSLILRQFALMAGNEVKTRFLIRSESVIIPDRSETIDATIEAVALATYNPFSLAAAQTTQAISLIHGTAAGKRCTLAVAAAQIQRPSGLEQQDGVVEWPLKYVPLPTSGNDQFTLAFT